MTTTPGPMPQWMAEGIAYDLGAAAEKNLSANEPTALGLMPPTSLSFCFGKETAVAIHADGRIVVNPKFSSDDAAKAFWDAVKKFTPFKPFST
jgi:hypothetical protein